MAKQPKLALTEINMAEVFEEIRESLIYALDDTQGRMDIGTTFSIQAVPAEIKYLMFHLVENAFYYRKKDTPPVIKVWMEASIQNQTCEIYVQDNGIGIDEKIVEAIFWSCSDTESYPDTGYGLKLCRQIVEGRGGSITVKRFSGEGTLFIVEVPCKIMPEYL